MHFHPFEVSIPHIIYAALGAFVVFFGMFSLFIREKLYIGEACWAFLFGVVIGPYGANIFDPRSWGGGHPETTNTITLEFTRVVLAIGVFAVGVELPKAYMARHWKSLAFLLGPIMTWGWFVSAGLIYALIPGLNFLSSLAVAACLTPTDPILAAAVIGGKYADKHVPAHLRHLLAAESGCNDGAAYPFLWIALYLIIDPSTGKAVGDWFLLLWLYQVVLGIVFGACLGVGFRYLMRFCERKDLIDRQSYVAQYVSLAMLTIGSCTLLGTDDLLAAFSCGAAFAWDGFFNRQTEESVFSSVIDLLFNIAAFVFVGAWMPFNSFADETLSLSVWRLVVIGILVILLRRLPIMIALYKWIPDVKTFREAIFSGHFGPMGIGAIFISTLAAEQLPEAHDPPENQQQLLAATIQPIVAFMVLCSILIHGLSIPFFTFGRRVHSVSRTWSRHDTLNRSHLPEWANLTRPAIRGEHIEINRDSDMERGEVTVRGDETPTNEKVGSTSSQTPTPTGDYREENPPDGREIIAEWKEGPHNIIERRAGPGEEVEVEVQENAYGPRETNIHRMHVAEHAAHDAVSDIRNKLTETFSGTHKNVEHAKQGVEAGIHHEAQQVGEILRNVESKTKEALSPTHSRQQNEDEDEGWLSDREGEQQGEASSDTRRKQPKIKQPKLAALRPAGSKRRRSIRSGMLGARAARHHSPDGLPTIQTMQPSIEDLNEPDSEPERGRRLPASGSAPTSPLGNRPHHARIDSLRSLDNHSRRSLREASPARSIRWADQPDPDDVQGFSLGHTRNNSGASTPRLLSPRGASPLPGGSAVHSENEAESEDSGNGVATPSSPQVRFSVPDDPRLHDRHSRS